MMEDGRLAVELSSPEHMDKGGVEDAMGSRGATGDSPSTYLMALHAHFQNKLGTAR